jgi:hypothetical protein
MAPPLAPPPRLLLPLLALLLGLLLTPLPAGAAGGSPPLLLGKRLSDSVLYYEMHVTVARGAPDCFTRDVVLVNGLFQPTIEVYTNDTLMVGRGAQGALEPPMRMHACMRVLHGLLRPGWLRNNVGARKRADAGAHKHTIAVCVRDRDGNQSSARERWQSEFP